MKKVAIVQSNYIPWIGYFDLINYVDEFILYDDMQYTRRDWRNRNKIKTPSGDVWLTVPVDVKGKYTQKICETKISNNSWKKNHLKSIELNYKKSKYFYEIYPFVSELYLERDYTFLSELNINLIRKICDYLEITTRISLSMDFDLIEGKSSRLADLTEKASGEIYISGPAARDYLDESEFSARNIRVQWYHYQKYAAYAQLWGNFIPNLSVLDVLFNCGRSSKNLITKVGD